MPTKTYKKPNNDRFQKRSVNIFKRITGIIFIILIMSYFLINGYNAILIPTLVSRTIKKNIQTVNIITVYTKEFEKNILGSLEQLGPTLSTQSYITSQLDLLSSKVITSKSDLEEGRFRDTKEFYKTIYSSLDVFEDLLNTTRNYLSYQFCFLKGQADIAKSKQLQTELLSQLESGNNLFDNPQIYAQLSSIYSLQNSIYTNLNTCFGTQFGYLKIENWDIFIATYINYTTSQSDLLTKAIQNAEKKDQDGLEQIFTQLAINDKQLVDLFSTDYYITLKYQPLQSISEENKALLAQYVLIQDNLNTIKLKYKLS